MNYLFIYTYIYIYIYKGKKAGWLSYSILFFSLGLRRERTARTNSSEHTVVLGVEREEPIEPEVSFLHEFNTSLNIRRTQEWISMGLIKVNFS